MTDTFEIMMWTAMFLLCGLFLFCGMFAYQYYLESHDEENIYGSGVHRITKYETALEQQKQKEKSDSSMMSM